MSRATHNLRHRLLVSEQRHNKLIREYDELYARCRDAEKKAHRLEVAFANEYNPAYDNLKIVNAELEAQLRKKK